MGKLLDLLNRVGRTTAPRLGFAVGSPERRPAMVVIAALPTPDPALAAAALAGGADALLVLSPGTKKAKGPLFQVLRVPESTVRGVVAGLAGAGQGGGWHFAVLEFGSPLDALPDAGGVDKVLRLPLELPTSTLRVLDALPVDAFVMPAPQQPVTLQHLLAYYRVVQSTRKPVMVSTADPVERTTLIALRDGGTVGVVLEVTADRVQQLAALRTMLADLPARKVSTGRGRPAVRLGAPPYTEAAPEQGDGDGDGDGDEEEGD